MIKDKRIQGKSFLVTGGLGFIGSHIVKTLVDNDAKLVRVLDNLTTGNISNLEGYLDKIDLVPGSITNEFIVEQAMIGIDYVSHQAAKVSVPRSVEYPLECLDTNVNGFNLLIDSARKNKILGFVYASSSAVYGDNESYLSEYNSPVSSNKSPYASSKYLNEVMSRMYSEVYNFHSIGLRYFNVYGPNQNPKGAYASVIPKFMTNILNKSNSIIFGDGTQTRDFVYVGTVVEANINALFLSQSITSSDVINVATGGSMSVNDLWDQLVSITETDTKVVYRSKRLGDIDYSRARVTKMRKLLNTNELPSERFDNLINTYKYYEKLYS